MGPDNYQVEFKTAQFSRDVDWELAAEIKRSTLPRPSKRLEAKRPPQGWGQARAKKRKAQKKARRKA